MHSLGSGLFSNPLARFFRSLPMRCGFCSRRPYRIQMIRQRSGLLLGMALVAVALAFCWLRAARQPPGTSVPSAPKTRLQQNYAKLPLSFEANVGQTDASVQFLARAPGYGLYLTGTEAVMVLKPAVDVRPTVLH